MDHRDSLSIVVHDCRFILNESGLRELLPSLAHELPPLTAIRYNDSESPRFTWGFPVVHGRRLLDVVHRLIHRQLELCLASPTYNEHLAHLSLAELREDYYFKRVSDALVRTLSEGTPLRLDSVFWLYLSEVVGARLNQERIPSDFLPEGSDKMELARDDLDQIMSRTRTRDARRYAEIRLNVLRSLLARNEFANSSLREVFDEVPSLQLCKEMSHHWLVFTERPAVLYRSFDLTDAFFVKGYRLAHPHFVALNRVLRSMITGILTRSAAGRPASLDLYFVRKFVTAEVRQKAQGLPISSQTLMEKNVPLTDPGEGELRERIAFLLALQEEPIRYLLFHVSLDERELMRPLEKSFGAHRDLLKQLKSRAASLELESQYSEVTHDVLKWDFFTALRCRLRWIVPRSGRLHHEGRALAATSIPLNLDSVHEIYRRSRYGTAVFFDLIGFSERTRALTGDSQPGSERQEEGRPDLSRISLAIQRIFAVRRQLGPFGGVPQGFEGDAILDIFPRALDSLRYVSAFIENYQKNQFIRFRPFEAPAENPYRDGFRVGLATGDYSVITIVNQTADLGGPRTQERAVGHTVNRASRLNSGKRSESTFQLRDEDAAGEEQDPLALFRVQVTSACELVNNGIASFEDTFLEIRQQVWSEGLRWYEPSSLRGQSIAGVKPLFQHYDFEFIFEDPQSGRVVLVRRLTRPPRLKGLAPGDPHFIYEYLLPDVEQFHELLRRDNELPSLQHSEGKGPSSRTIGGVRGTEPGQLFAREQGGHAVLPVLLSLAPQAYRRWRREAGPGLDPVRGGPPAPDLQGDSGGSAGVRSLIASAGFRGRRNGHLRGVPRGSSAETPASQAGLRDRREHRVVYPSPLPAFGTGVSIAELKRGPEAVRAVAEGLLGSGPERSPGQEANPALREAGSDDGDVPRGEMQPGEAPRGAPQPGEAVEGYHPARVPVESGALADSWHVTPDPIGSGFSIPGGGGDAPPAFDDLLHWDRGEDEAVTSGSEPAAVPEPEAISVGREEASFVEAPASESDAAPMEDGAMISVGDLSGLEWLDFGEGVAPAGPISEPTVVLWSPGERDAMSLAPEPGGTALDQRIEISLLGEPEVEAMATEYVLGVSKGRSLKRETTDQILLGPEPQENPGGAPHPWALSHRLPDYVYAAVDRLLADDGLVRVIIGQVNASRLQDVHLYNAPQVCSEPWHLDPVFSRFLTEKHRDGFTCQPTTWVIAPPFSNALAPLPLLHLERLYRDLLSSGEIAPLESS